MKKISLFILSAFLVSALSSKSVQAQSACNGTLFGIPVCTGFCFDKKDDVKKKERVKRLRHEADSLNKEANKLSDSLKGFFLNSDSLNLDMPFHIHGNMGSSNGFLEQPPATIWGHTSPFEFLPPHDLTPNKIEPKQKENPMTNFNGWYIKKLETAELVK